MLVVVALSSTFSINLLPVYIALPVVLLTTTIAMMLPLFRFLFGFALASSVSKSVEASNFSKAHAHTGKVEPFTPGDPKIKLDGKATSILRAGKPYQVSS